MLFQHLDKNNLHHAYLIEGAQEEIVPELMLLMKRLDVATTGNPDFMHIALDSFKVEDARNLRTFGIEKGISKGKKIFIVSANNFLLEAQNTMLKMFEEPIENTHFFLIVPDSNILIPTLVSRFYFIKNTGREVATEDAEKFITMSLPKRLDFIKELLVADEESDEDTIVINSARARALKFLNSLEFVLHNKEMKNLNAHNFSLGYFQQIFKVREFLRMPGSSAKSLMESVALIVPAVPNL